LAAAGWCAAAPIAAQSVANRIAAVRDGTVRMSFAARPGVCGDGRGSVRFGRRQTRILERSPMVCVAGPVRVAIGRTTDAEYTQMGVGKSAAASKPILAMCPARGGALPHDTYSLGGGSGDEALTAAAFADAGDLSPELRLFVRDDDAPLQSRRQALFWLGQSDFPTRDLARLYETLTPYSLREHFTFVLSQRHDDEAVAKLIDVARNDRDLGVRKQAMFWLGQSKDQSNSSSANSSCGEVAMTDRWCVSAARESVGTPPDARAERRRDRRFGERDLSEPPQRLRRRPGIHPHVARTRA
jgi:hypothetical protein